MKKEVTISAPSVEEAIEKAVAELGALREACSIEVLETPKRSLFGKNKEAVVRASVELEEPQAEKRADVHMGAGAHPQDCDGKLVVARAYLQTILDAMELHEITMEISENEEGAMITFNGTGMAVLIGHHGETLDALQYLVALTCNRADGEYYRVTLDCGNYREKRETTLQGLATRIAAKVKKTGRSQLLEPMNPYERRIIHAIVSDIEGVYSKSKGEEPNRRVVILSDSPAVVTFHKNTNRKEDSRANNGATYRGGERREDRKDFRKEGGAAAPPTAPRKGDYKPYVHKPERTMEEILKSDFKKREEDAELYSKVEL